MVTIWMQRWMNSRFHDCHGCQVKNKPMKEHDELGIWVGS